MLVNRFILSRVVLKQCWILLIISMQLNYFRFWNKQIERKNFPTEIKSSLGCNTFRSFLNKNQYASLFKAKCIIFKTNNIHFITSNFRGKGPTAKDLRGLTIKRREDTSGMFVNNFILSIVESITCLLIALTE